MILLDTNVLIDALDKSQENHLWARKQIQDAVAANGGGISVVTLAELYAGACYRVDMERVIKGLGLTVHDVPAAAASTCGTAYRRYATARRNSGGGPSPKMPLPDFFIGAQAEIMGWKIATRDQGRFEKYFPAVVLVDALIGWISRAGRRQNESEYQNSPSARMDRKGRTPLRRPALQQPN